MENYVSVQLGQLGAAAALGAAAGLVYDLLRSARLIDRRDRRLTHLLDALFAAALGTGLLWLALVVGDGELRLYMVTAMTAGALLWFALLSPLLRPLWDFWIDALLALCRLLAAPFLFMLRQLKKLATSAKRVFSFPAKWVRMKKETPDSGTTQDTPPERGGMAVARAKKQKKKRRTSPLVMLVILLLAAVLGVQIVKVYGQLRTARQEEAALGQQLQIQQQENDALRSDLEKKDDESFIRALARDLLGLAEEGERIFYDVND